MANNSTGKIVTVTGEVTPDSSLFYQCHEHILMGKGRPGELYPELYYDEVDKSLQDVQDYVNAGGKGLVDAQPGGGCRMTEGLVEIAQKTGAHIIASTGYHKMAFYPENHWNFTESEDWLTDLYIHELTQGMYVDFDDKKPERWILHRAGQIKTAMDNTKMNDQYCKLFSAAANAACETGAPLMMHVENGHHPMEYFEFLVKKGVRPEQMIICHLDRAWKDVEVHKELAKAGAFIEYDTIARWKYHSDERELEIMQEMIEAGYEDQLLFSLDTTRKRLKSYGGEVTLNYILETFVDMMKGVGITQEVIDKISKVNPAKALAWR